MIGVVISAIILVNTRYHGSFLVGLPLTSFNVTRFVDACHLYRCPRVTQGAFPLSQSLIVRSYSPTFPIAVRLDTSGKARLAAARLAIKLKDAGSASGK